jgi:hypothetical protein
MSTNQEKINFGPERKQDLEALEHAGEQQREVLRNRHEKVGELSRENIDDARHEALERATSIEHEDNKKEIDRQPSPAERRKDGPIGKVERDTSFQATMHEVQSQMSAPSRVFSKIIHNKTVEKASDVIGSTIARPNALLLGAILAFVLTLAVYLVAKNIGYRLSGFEPIGAFILGWVLGIAYDFLKVMVTGRK